MAAPVNTVLPSINISGATLLGVDGTYTGTLPISIVYRWMKAVTSGGVPIGAAGAWVGLEIAGETGADYTPTIDLSDEFFFRDEKASNVDGETTWISSDDYVSFDELGDSNYTFTRRDVHEIRSA